MVSEWIRTLYRLQPHVILPAPLAAVEQDIEVCGKHFKYSPTGEIVSAAFASDSNIELAWAKDGCQHLLVDLLKEVIKLNRISFLAINHTRYPICPEHFGFKLRGRYFRLVHIRHKNGLEAKLPDFKVSSYTHLQDDEVAVEFIKTCYSKKGISISLQQLKKLRDKRFFVPALWFWIVERSSKRPCALAICHHDTETGEGWLDWIQVLPDFQRRGLGTMLVNECVSYLKKGRMITVSGNLDNPHKPLELYRKCGFGECQEWFIMGKTYG